MDNQLEEQVWLWEINWWNLSFLNIQERVKLVIWISKAGVETPNLKWMIKSTVSSKELWILILANKISQGEDRLKAGSKKAFLVSRKIRIRIKDHSLVKVTNSRRITIPNLISIKIKKITVQYLKKMEIKLIKIIKMNKVIFSKIMKVMR